MITVKMLYQLLQTQRKSKWQVLYILFKLNFILYKTFYNIISKTVLRQG